MANNYISKFKLPNGTVYNIKVNLSNIEDADDLRVIEALTGTGLLKRTGDNTWALDSTAYQTLISNTNKLNAAYLTGTASVNTSGKATTAGTADTANAVKDSINLGGSPTAPTVTDVSDSSTKIATTAFVQEAINAAIGGAANALVFEGTVSAATGLTSKTIGSTYIASDSFTYGGEAVETGDMLICTATTPKYAIIQTNIDGAVTSSSTASTNGNVTTMSGTGGRTIQDSGVALSDLAKKTDLVDTLTGTPGVGKTITAFDEVDGKVSATFENISITKSQVSDFPTSMTPTSHTHGNISNTGAITSDTTAANGDKIVLTDASNSSKLIRSSIAIGTGTTTYLRNDGTWATPPNDNTNYYHTSGTWDGLKYTATANGGAGELSLTIPTGTSSTTVALGNHTHSGYAASTHTHGNITSAGLLGTASRIVVTDADKKITVGSIDPANLVVTTDTRLSDARTPTSHTHGNITNAGAIGTTSGYAVYTTTDGVLTAGTLATTDPTASTTTATTFIDTISQDAKGKITATKKTLPVTGVSVSRSLTSGTKVGSITINGTSTDLYAPTATAAPYAYVSTTTTNSNYPVLFKNSTSTTTTAAGDRFDASAFYFNPSTDTLTVAKYAGNGASLTNVSRVTTSATAPSANYAGDLWYEIL